MTRQQAGVSAEAAKLLRREVLEEAAQVVKKWNFMACSDADGLMEIIRALAEPAAEKE